MRVPDGISGFGHGRAAGPLAPPDQRDRLCAQLTGDSRHILLSVQRQAPAAGQRDGETGTVPLDLNYRVHVPKGRLVLHVGKLVDGFPGPPATTWTL
jgi:hypothetical protein